MLSLYLAFLILYPAKLDSKDPNFVVVVKQLSSKAGYVISTYGDLNNERGTDIEKYNKASFERC